MRRLPFVLAAAVAFVLVASPALAAPKAHPHGTSHGAHASPAAKAKKAPAKAHAKHAPSHKAKHGATARHRPAKKK